MKKMTSKILKYKETPLLNGQFSKVLTKVIYRANLDWITIETYLKNPYEEKVHIDRIILDSEEYNALYEFMGTISDNEEEAIKEIIKVK